MTIHPCFFAARLTLSTLLLVSPQIAGAQAQSSAAQVGSQLSLSRPADLTQPPSDAEHSPSGLVSKVLIAGTGSEHPDANDMVSVHFVGWAPDGKLFANSVERGQPAVFDVSQLFAGFREGVLKMVHGEVRRLWIPASLAPPKPAQGPSGAVVIDVELLAMVKLPPAPVDLLRAPAEAERTSSGALSKVLEKGTGSVRPERSDKVLVIYTGWTRDGRIFDSSLKRFRPTMFLLETVMPGFAEGVRQMVEGEQRRLWIPASVANRQWPGSPEGDLVFDVQLIQIVK